MRFFSRLAFLAAFLAVMILPLSLMSAKKEEKKPSTSSSFPDTYLSQLDKGERFKNPDYFRILAGDGIRTADPRGLFHRVSVAVGEGKNYKALYLARLFTVIKPDSPEGWANRASIAATLGLKEESAASQANSERPDGARPVPLGVLPGNGLQVRPKDTYDWAAAMALVADGLASKVGPNHVVSVRDDVSGIHVSTPQELADLNEELAKDDLPPNGPWAVSEPVRATDVLQLIFLGKWIANERKDY